VLNPLGVPSRMNVGQILETHLAWAGHELGKKITQLLAENTREETIKRELKTLFKDTPMVDYVADLNGDELEAAAKGLTKGVFMASPVFDGAGDTETEARLERSGLPTSGKRSEEHTSELQSR